MALLGLDLGTTGCKAILFTPEGRRLGGSYREYRVISRAAGMAELDSAAVMDDAAAVLTEAASASREPIDAISVSSMGEAFVPVTRDRRVLGPSLLNFDTRGSEYLEELRSVISDEKLYSVSGNPSGSNYAAVKLMWMARNSPRVCDEADFFLFWSGFVLFMLGGRPACDYTLANRSLLFDVDRLCWNTALSRALGINPHRLPDLVGPGEVVGRMDPGIAGELGMSGRPLLVAGAHDQCANALGCGALDSGTAMYGMGTFHCVVIPFAERPPSEPMLSRGLNTEHHAVPDRFVTFVYNQGGILLKWFRDTFLTEKRDLNIVAGGINIYEDIMDELPRTPSSVLVSPNFSVTGPPDFREDVTGLISGLTLTTSRGDIAKGILEGVAYYLRENIEGLPVQLSADRFRVVGAGSRSDVWVQLLADIFGLPFRRTEENEAGTLGAAIIAAAGCGTYEGIRAGAEAMVRLADTVEPDPDRHEAYSESYRRYRSIQPLFGEFLAEQHRRFSAPVNFP